MKRQYVARRDGAVLLLILGLMAMFAISILTYMVVTSNMAETAQNSAKLDSVVEIPAQEDVDAALKNVVLGSNNERNPIGPFGILENMYGDWREYDDAGAELTSLNGGVGELWARIQFFPNMGCVVVVPDQDMYGTDLDSEYIYYERDSGDSDSPPAFPPEHSDQCRAVMDIFNKSGGVLTFEDCDNMPSDARDLWDRDVKGTSAFVLEKVITNPTAIDGSSIGHVDGDYWENHYHDGLTLDSITGAPIDPFVSKGHFACCDSWHFKVELTDDLKRFVVDYCGNFSNVNSKLNELDVTPMVKIRLNLPAYSGTGAGGFSPGEMKDASFQDPSLDGLRIPYAFWGNAAAPDLDFFSRPGKDSFRTFWAHLIGFNYETKLGIGFGNGASFHSIRMNPAYTAPDNRSMFLAKYTDVDSTPEHARLADFSNIAQIIPSFHRPSLFESLADYYSSYSAAYGGNNSRIASVVRKLTPRPLPIDHFHFTGGNHYLNNPDGNMNPQDLVNLLAKPDDGQWDVDNDGDGIREGIWIPSGLPIRVDKNGRAYATMYSYTILDLDGRVNVNTAGSWDQLPNNLEGLLPFDYVDELSNLNSSSEFPFARPAFDWLDENGNRTDVAVRGDGRGVADVRLYEAISSIFFDSSVENHNNDEIAKITSNLLWRRYLPLRSSLSNGEILDVNAGERTQPGYDGEDSGSYDPACAAVFRYMDPVRLLANNEDLDSVLHGSYILSNDPDASLGDAKMVYPYRGKTTLNLSKFASSAVYDYANTAFRSYDPLGAQVYTYVPRYSNNPYLVYQNYRSFQDSPYTLPMLERLLRPWDADANSLPSQLVDDLGLSVDPYGSSATETERAKARGSLTTLSSDVPSPSLVFPENNELEEGDYRGGRFGFVDLIRNCVRSELIKVFRAKIKVDRNGNPVDPADYIDRYINPYAVNADFFDKKVDEITAYLAAMLPPEILAGEKIDLNALAQKDYWLDIDDSDPDNLIAAGDENTNPGVEFRDDRRLHNYGLVKRMERACGLYIVIMTLLYEDMNAETLYGDNNGKLEDYVEGSLDLLKFSKGGKKEAEGLMSQELIATRIAQWCVNTIDFADPDATMTPFFFDPTPFDGWWIYNNDAWIDAKVNGEYCWLQTITPTTNVSGNNPEPEFGFQFDPSDPGNLNDHKIKYGFLFDPARGRPSEQMFHFFNDALNDSEIFVSGANYKDAGGKDVYFGADFVPAKVDDDGNVTAQATCALRRSDEDIAAWMSKKIERIEDQTSDMGFRLCWGMERPDLVLTETLSFHDLGIADTDKETDIPDTDAGKVAAAKDETFDQVRLPEGSTYLELYCTANPNVPQSRELYDYDASEKVWELLLSKQTPAYTNSEGNEIEMPIWRVAISASADPRGQNLDKNNANLKKGNKLVYNKRRNSVLEWLSPSKSGSDYEDDISFFSMQPRQFRNYPMKRKSGGHKIDNIGDYDIIQEVEGADGKPRLTNAPGILEEWEAFNLSSSNILGPAVAETDDDYLTKEVEIDRIVWFASGEEDDDNSGGLNLGIAGDYPDALRTFANKSKVNLHLAPNQYLVVGPEENRAIGSVALNTATKDADGHEHFGEKTDLHFNHIDLENLGVKDNNGNLIFKANAKYMVAEANIGGRGLNISEPLWTATHDSLNPYRIKAKDGFTKILDKDMRPGARPGAPEEADGSTERKGAVMDVPYELPKEWCKNGRDDVDPDFYDNTIANYPIVQDGLFGVGTIPAYKTAFVQRVADPNRPYHPLMNPYITVDWNMMDLTVFTGECVQTSGVDNENKQPFSADIPDPPILDKPSQLREYIDGAPTGRMITRPFADYPFGGKVSDNPSDHKIDNEDENIVKSATNTALNLYDGDRVLSYNEVFSSRQWGNSEQKAFAPGIDERFDPVIHPNPWARAFKGEGHEAGLQEPTEIPASVINDLGSHSRPVPVIQSLPKHTLGMFNDMGDRGNWTELADGSHVFNPNGSGASFKNLNSNPDQTSGVYSGAPRVPFEHLVWNDAPYSNPMELALVPASSPGRFGLEFVRFRDEEKINKTKVEIKGVDLSRLYEVDKENKNSLGSFGIFGFKDWYNDNNIKYEKAPAGGVGVPTWDVDDEWKKLKGKANVVGPYLNFFASSKTLGETLNLCNALEFVYVPSMFMGTKKIAVNSLENVVTEPFFASDGDYLGSNPLLISKRREPGKINLNTVTKSAWKAISPNSERVQVDNRLPGAPYSDEALVKDVDDEGAFFYDNLLGFKKGSRYPYVNVMQPNDVNGDGVVDNDDKVPEPLNSFCYFQPSHTHNLWAQLKPSESPVPSYMSVLGQFYHRIDGETEGDREPLFDNLKERFVVNNAGLRLFDWMDVGGNTGRDTWDDIYSRVDDGTIEFYSEAKTERRNNLYEATAEMQRLSGLTTTRSNVFAVWVTVGYFEVERCNPGVNMPDHDPDGNPIYFGNPTRNGDLTNSNYKWYQYYQAIYPDGYTYGKELGSEFGESKRHRGFSIIDRSIPVDFRRGNSSNYKNSILLQRVID